VLRQRAKNSPLTNTGVLLKIWHLAVPMEARASMLSLQSVCLGHRKAGRGLSILRHTSNTAGVAGNMCSTMQMHSELVEYVYVQGQHALIIVLTCERSPGLTDISVSPRKLAERPRLRSPSPSMLDCNQPAR
jgi:hypothetical protein